MARIVQHYEDVATVHHETVLEKIYRKGQGSEQYQQTVRNSDRPPKRLKTIEEANAVVTQWRANRMGAAAADDDHMEDVSDDNGGMR